MENASNALMIAGGVLIGILVAFIRNNYELNGSDIDEILCVPYNKISNGYEF